MKSFGTEKLSINNLHIVYKENSNNDLEKINVDRMVNYIKHSLSNAIDKAPKTDSKQVMLVYADDMVKELNKLKGVESFVRYENNDVVVEVTFTPLRDIYFSGTIRDYK